MRLLLHICCAPDATVAFEELAPLYRTEGFFYNPNIHPPEEYRRRLQAMERLAAAAPCPFSPGEYDSEHWQEAVRGLEGEPEGGLRCRACFAHNLGRTAREARERGFGLIATTLTISPHKDAALINDIGAREAERAGVGYLPTDLKKKDGFRRSVQLSRRYDLYRQNYCGCRYSLQESLSRRSR